MILFDTRWEGAHGIGRMTAEICRRVFVTEDFISPKTPRSPLNPADALLRGIQLIANPNLKYYSPGFNPPAFKRARAVFTVCDLIHLRVPSESGRLKRLYYEKMVKPAISQCFRVLTISEYSKTDIIKWTGAPENQIVNIGCGVDGRFFDQVAGWQPGYPYFLYVGARKPHKNLDRLLEAYALSHAVRSIRLVLSGAPDQTLIAKAEQLGIAKQLIFAGRIADESLPAYYQGATALLFPSYFEGFGLPPIEAMAGGVPTLTSNVTSLPEVIGNGALTVDPFSIDALRHGIDRIAGDEALRSLLSSDGPIQARKHSWDSVAEKVKAVLNELVTL